MFTYLKQSNFCHYILCIDLNCHIISNQSFFIHIHSIFHHPNAYFLYIHIVHQLADRWIFFRLNIYNNNFLSDIVNNHLLGKVSMHCSIINIHSHICIYHQLHYLSIFCLYRISCSNLFMCIIYSFYFRRNISIGSMNFRTYIIDKCIDFSCHLRLC